MDEMVSMVLELTAETWVIKKRLYLLERVAEKAGVSLTDGIEQYNLDDTELAELDEMRRKLIATVMRSTEADFAPIHRVRDRKSTVQLHDDAAAA